MADIRRKHPANVPGPWFVDDTCIDCDATRQIAPDLIAAVHGGSAFTRQPETAEEQLAAVRALLACPVGAVGVAGPTPAFRDAFPQELDGGVYYCGFNAAKSFGANAFFVRRSSGNLLVDSPRYVPSLVRRFDELGGIRHILLTHQDDVADADRYAARFGARVWIHDDDRRAAPYATGILVGQGPTEIAPALVAIPLPGHTRGSVAYLLEERFLFSGDSLYWSRETQDLAAYPDYTWYSWPAQLDSLERLAHYAFEWVLAGHGDRHHLPAGEMQARLRALVARASTGRRRVTSAP